MTEKMSTTHAGFPKLHHVMRLWDHDAPHAAGNQSGDIPTLTFFPPTAPPTGAAMVICPGGGYQVLAEHEGEPMAKWLASVGIACAVLQYRLAPRYKHPAMLLDAARAVRTVRAHSKDWDIDPTKIGIMGSSAGGHLTASLCVHYDAGDASAPDPIDRVSSRPDLGVLLYPVISMDRMSHGGSRANLLGDSPEKQMIDHMSTEKQVNEKTPPAFLFHTMDDGVVPVENSMEYAAALRRAGVSFELHVFEHGPHGVGLAEGYPALATWPRLCANWLRRRKFAD
jgi:acetyl esterase/lipase